MPEGQHRLFIAIPVPPAIRESVDELLAPIRALTPPGRGPRWVDTASLHVTLRFLGDTPAARVPEVGDAVRGAVRDARPFDVRLAGAGAFPPDARKVRALWLGIAEGAAELAAIVASLEAPLAALGWPREPRPFRPHLTIARTDATSIAQTALVAQALEAAAERWEATFTVDRVVLYRSTLGQGPPRHDAVETVELRAQPG